MYIVMELMTSSVRDLLINKPKEVTIRDIIKMAKDVASAMYYLSQRNVIHRDLATRNLLVNTTGQEYCKYIVKVADLGLCRRHDDVSYYKSNKNAFPRRWAAPEVFTTGKFREESDVWAFGIVMWELFEYGKSPYPQLDNEQIRKSVVDEKNTMGCPDNCPQEFFNDIIKPCWKYNHEDRPKFQHLCNVLSRFIPEEPEASVTSPLTPPMVSRNMQSDEILSSTSSKIEYYD